MIEVRAVLPPSAPANAAAPEGVPADAAASPFLAVLAGQLAGDGAALDAGARASAAAPAVDPALAGEEAKEPADTASAADAVAALGLPGFIAPSAPPPQPAPAPASAADAAHAAPNWPVPAGPSAFASKAQAPSEAAGAQIAFANALDHAAERRGGAGAGETATVALDATSAPAAAAHGAAAPSPARADAPQAQATVQAPVHESAFGREVGERVAVFVRAGVQSAELRVTPADLGPVTVRIDLSGTEASVAFTVAHADTREALQDALPRLRELLEANGIQLAEASVSGQGHPRGDARGEGDARTAGRPAAVAEDALPGATARVVVPRGLVDTYA